MIMRSILLKASLVLILNSVVWCKAAPDYQNPVQTSDEDEIKSLPGLNSPISFRQFSGYLRADEDQVATKFQHYWFVESQSDPSKDPLVLWLNGGPGCSSLDGLLTELGPFRVDSDGKTLTLNDYSWNKLANVLFMESPTEVGFSYSTKGKVQHDDDSTARENYLAIKSFINKFPQYKNRSLYITGESYAGVYLPTLGVLLNADPEINLRGVAIGNAFLDTATLTDTLIFFLYHHGFFGKSLWDQLSRDCCNGLPPSLSNCRLTSSGASSKCSGVMYLVNLKLETSGINPYNIYNKCEGSPYSDSLERGHIDRALMRSIQIVGKSSINIADFVGTEPKFGEDPPCTNSSLQRLYLGQKGVREALHIPEKVQNWDICTTIDYRMIYATLPGGLGPQMRHLIESPRNLSMLIYNGDVDAVCNFLADEKFLDDLGLPVKSAYQPWMVSKQIAGWVKHYEGITFATIRGSGHMVPADKPKEALQMFQVFLKGHAKNVALEKSH